MSRLRAIMCVVALTGFTIGCGYVIATPSVQGRAFVVQSGLFSSTYWSCDATGAQPVCYQTKQKPLEEK